jgi:hypothetical protein
MFGTRTDGLPKVISVHLGSPGRLLFAGLKLRKQTPSVRKFPFPELTRGSKRGGIALGLDGLSQRANGAKFSLFRKQRAALRANLFGWGCHHRDLTRFWQEWLTKRIV